MTDNKRPKVRFAPSPTGYLHVGGARTALFNYLYSRKHNGVFLLRIEDTDVKREQVESYQAILKDIKWLGLTWDEGPIRQTERLHVYQKYADDLIKKGYAYPCYCTPEELDKKRKKMMARGETPKYDGECRNLTPQQRKEKEAQGRTPCTRFVVPDVAVTVNDLVRGEVTYDKGFCGDFVIMKSDGTPSYNFAVVIDDHEMGVTHVIRGEEHLVNTPRQILIYRALGFDVPEFAHTSMILAPDRSKMSKRHGTVAVGEYKKQGYLPQALLNYIAILGWSPEDEKEFFTLGEMEDAFSLDRVSKSPSVYDETKLRWMNSKYIKDMDDEALLEALLPFWKAADYMTEEIIKPQRERLLEIVKAMKNRLEVLADVKEEARIFFDDDIRMEPEAQEVLSWETTPAVFSAFIEVLDEVGDFTNENFMKAVKMIQKKSKAKGKKLYMPLRVGITGQAHGVEMQYVLTLLTKEQMQKRLKQVMGMIPASSR